MKVLLVSDVSDMNSKLRAALDDPSWILYIIGCPDKASIYTLERSIDLILINSRLIPYGSEQRYVEKLSSVNVPITVFGFPDHLSGPAVYLDAGAEDYLNLYSSYEEIRARIKSTLRKRMSIGCTYEGIKKRSIEFCDLIISPMSRTMKGGRGSITLSHSEIAMMAVLIERHPAPICRTLATELLYRREWLPGDRAVDITVSRLRPKLKKILTQVDIISIRGVGYILNLPNAMNEYSNEHLKPGLNQPVIS